jgi:hypothetical protein
VKDTLKVSGLSKAAYGATGFSDIPRLKKAGDVALTEWKP